MSSIDQAIEASRVGLESLGFDDPLRPDLLSSHAEQLLIKYMRTLETDDLDKAVHIYQDILAEPSQFTNQSLPSFNYALLLRDKHTKTGLASDFDNAIRAAQEAIALDEGDDPKRSEFLRILAVWPAESAFLSDPTPRAIPFFSPAARLSDRFYEAGQISYLDELLQTAVAKAPRVQPQRPLVLRPGEKYLAEVSLDVPEDIQVTGCSNPAMFLNNMGLSLGMRYRELGAEKDIYQGISVLQEAIKSTEADDPNHSDLPLFWNNLGLLLEHRYERTKAMDDLEESSRLLKQSVKATPRGDPAYPTRLNNLGLVHGHLFSRTRNIGRLHDAIWATSEAVKMAKKTHPNDLDLPLFLNNLGRLYGDWADVTESSELRDTAMLNLQAAVEGARSQQPPHDDLAMFLNNLSGAFQEKYHAGKLPGDLDKAVVSLKDAVAATPKTHPDRAVRLYNLGLLLREEHSRDDNLQAAISCFQEALDATAAPVMSRIVAGREVLACCLDNLNLNLTCDWDQAYEALDKAVRLVPALAPKSLGNVDKQYVLSQVVGLTSDAAAVALEAGKGAVVALKLLEIGRGIIAKSLEDVRTEAPVRALRAHDPKLAEQFIRIRDELDFSAWSAGSGPSWLDEASRRHDIMRQFEDLVEAIRQRSGFQGFLLPPSQEDLQAAAEHGPIVLVNVSRRLGRCDAFLVERHQIRVLALPGLRYGDLEKNSKGRDLGNIKILEWLWDALTRPVLDALGFDHPPSDENWPRLWWVPTGLLTRFPLHATGRYQKASVDTVLDRVMSSYASSIQSIISGRRQGPQEYATGSQKALLVRMENTLGHTKLQYAADEIDSLRNLLETMNVPFVEPERRKADILSHLPACTLFHFAGHATADEADPSRSFLALEDWDVDRLTVADLRDLNLWQNAPFLAYLSACNTSQIKDGSLFDENVHLVSAFQLAGFRHVVGTLWEVQDRSSSEMARITYKTMHDDDLTDVSVCRGLHRASRELRDRWWAGKPGAEGTVIAEGAEKQEQGLAIIRDDNTGKGETVPRDGTLLIAMGKSGKGGDEGGAKDFGEAFWVPYVHFGV